MFINLTDLAWFDYVRLCWTSHLDSETKTESLFHRGFHGHQPLRRLGHHGLPSESHVLRLWRRSHKDAPSWLRCTMAQKKMIRGIIMIYPPNTWLVWSSLTYLVLLGAYWSTIEFVVPYQGGPQTFRGRLVEEAGTDSELVLIKEEEKKTVLCDMGFKLFSQGLLNILLFVSFNDQ